MTQTTIKKYELKYIFTVEQYETLFTQIPSDTKLDSYGKDKHKKYCEWI